MVMFTFSVCERKYPLEQIRPEKIKIVSLRSNLVPNSNIQKSMIVFTFSVLDQKYPLWANMIHKSNL